MTNEEKAEELAKGFGIDYYAKGSRHPIDHSFDECYKSALEMAEWKDKEWEEKIRKWLSFNTNWNSEYDEEGRNPDYGKIDEMFDEIKKGLI